MTISVLVLTKNEAQDLPGCLASVAWSDDVHVFDSFSTDATTELARQQGAQVHQRVFDGYAAQRNAALTGCPFKHEWILILDADERVPAALHAEMQRFIAGADPALAAARIRRRDFFMNTWLKHAQISPWYIRLVRRGRAHYEREVNEVLVVDGTIHDLHEPFDHFPFSKGIEHWLNKHNTYSSMEARLLVEQRRGGPRFSLRAAVFGRDFNERRWHQKGLFYKLPFRPLVKWLYMMFWRGAFLDGRAGFTYACLQAYYEYQIVLKARELETLSDSAT